MALIGRRRALAAGGRSGRLAIQSRRPFIENRSGQMTQFSLGDAAARGGRGTSCSCVGSGMPGSRHDVRMAPVPGTDHRMGLTYIALLAGLSARLPGTLRPLRVPPRDDRAADGVIPCREPPAGSAHEGNGLVQRGPRHQQIGGRTSCRTYDVLTMSASPSRTSKR